LANNHGTSKRTKKKRRRRAEKGVYKRGFKGYNNEYRERVANYRELAFDCEKELRPKGSTNKNKKEEKRN